MQPMRIACLQLNSGPDIAANGRAIAELAEQAVAAGAEMLALPENAYFMRADDRSAPPHHGMDTHPGIAHACGLAQSLGVRLLLGSVLVAQGEKWANRSLLIGADGVIVRHYDKIHLFDAYFGDESYRESDRIAGGDCAMLADLPCGTMGLTICYDLRFPGLYRALAQAGATILAIPAAFTRRTGEAHWHVLLRARAIENGCYVIAPAQCGNHPGGRQTFGHSLIIDPWGTILAEATADQPGFIMATIDPQRVADVRRQMPVLQNEKVFSIQYSVFTEEASH